MFKFLNKFLDSNEKQVTKIRPLVAAINEQESAMHKLKDADFPKITKQLQNRFADGSSLDELLVEAYALTREAAHRTIRERPYDVQLIAAIVLHQGKVAEQKTGEGKTLSASLPLFLNALTGRGVHLVTVNDYLVRVGVGWMGPVYHFLGLSVAAMIHDQSFIYDPEFIDESATDWRLRNLRPISRKAAYEADITYGVNSEFGFDYLRDNMVSDLSQAVQREYHYAIVDEVDSVLIDEARTPHIISAPVAEPTGRYYDYAKFVSRLNPDTDYTIDEKLRTAHLTENGIIKIEKMLGITNIYENDFEAVHHIEAALKARTLFHIDKEYVVRDGQVIIVDEFTGRMLPGRRFSEGLHQAIEAKESVAIQQESRTLATVSLQNYFRKYSKLAGMTGTAATEAEEFHKIYNLDVVTIPTHRTLVRRDHGDMVYKTVRAKYAAVAAEVAEYHKRGTPVLVGTTSIENNELVSGFLRKKGVPHELLNAKNHEKEAMVIANAGNGGAVTVATNMAGRGVDIILGGMPPDKYVIGADKKELERAHSAWRSAHDKVVKLGGLHVVGTERHESRRIDNQLRGRSGRQGDPGSSRFFVSLEDDIMRLFGGEQVARLMTIFNLPEDVPLEHGMVSKAIEQAQVKVEGFHFDSRKHLVEYDDVINKQREVIYTRRRKILEGQDLREEITDSLQAEIAHLVGISTTEKGSIDYKAIMAEFITIVPFDDASRQKLAQGIKQKTTAPDLIEFLSDIVTDIYERREKEAGSEVMRQIERWVSLSTIDNLWMDHLTAIDDLREGIGLRGYGQRDPLVEYKNEAYSMFERLIGSIDGQIARRIFRVHVHLSPDQTQAIKQQNESKLAKAAKPQLQKREEKPTVVTDESSNTKKLGRNDPCWCNSGRKWKKCHYPNLG